MTSWSNLRLWNLYHQGGQHDVGAVDVVLIDDNEVNFRALVKLVERTKVLFGNQDVRLNPYSLLVPETSDGSVDAVLERVRRIQPGVAVVDMRLEGDDPDDYSGVDLSLKIKALCSDCCIILISAFFDEIPDFPILKSLEVFRGHAKRPDVDEDSSKGFQCSLSEAVCTHMATVQYRTKRFMQTINNGKPDMWGLVLDRSNPKGGISVRPHLHLPLLRSDTVAVEPIEVGVCGTDRCALGLSPTRDYEVIDFHEAFGRVVWTGEGVRNLRVGDYVVPWCDVARHGLPGRWQDHTILIPVSPLR